MGPPSSSAGVAGLRWFGEGVDKRDDQQRRRRGPGRRRRAPRRRPASAHHNWIGIWLS